MGAGIAQVAILHGLETTLYDLDAASLQNGRNSISKNLTEAVAKGKISAAAQSDAIGRLRCTQDMSACVADMILEAIVEKTEPKISLLLQLAAINSRNTILASNTSSLSVTGIASRLPLPERVIGMHFFNPAPRMPLVEIIRTPFTSQPTLEATQALARRLGKTAVCCRDSPGFIVNRVARPYYLEALRLLEEGLTDIETIDGLMEASGFRMGPFRLMDLIGNDVNYAVSCSLYEALGKPERLKPAAIQAQKVQDGHLGRKRGQGYYRYP